MAVIPPDAGVRMRTQTDPGQLQALAPVRGVPGDLPEFQPGQSFTARIQEVLPDNTYKALIAGRQLTLQLPEGANAGDLLELTVVDRTPRMLIARRAEGQLAPGQADARPYQYARISDAGRLIGQLLPAEGESPPPAALSRGQPVLAQPPVTGSQLASALQKAVSESGLFYEAHQAQWVAGQRALASLRAEPQGQMPVTPGPAHAVGPETSRTEPGAGVRSEMTLRLSDMSTGPDVRSQAAAQPAAAPGVPDSIRSIVQQQLDAVATQRLAWHGEVWPGQSVDWAIEREEIEGRNPDSAESGDAPRWSTSLRLTMPRLGTVDAVLQLSGGRLRIRLAAADADAANDLRRQAANLTGTLTSEGLTVQSLEIRHES